MRMEIFWILAALIIGLGVWHGLNTRQQVAKLELEGFQVDERLLSSPSLALDDSQQMLAVVYADRAERYPYSSIRGWRAHVRERKRNEETSYRWQLDIFWQDSQRTLSITTDKEVEWQRWAGVLRQRWPEEPATQSPW
ncbi:hypothetical protein [Balneatrix alpica]|uniref:hypothetical protein n=1 Tax=Balneatrix alpica TaxID=75684 RepID=UPI002738F960|nr:hypothetical protein [Balneatrix alpica]